MHAPCSIFELSWYVPDSLYLQLLVCEASGPSRVSPRSISSFGRLYCTQEVQPFFGSRSSFMKIHWHVGFSGGFGFGHSASHFGFLRKALAISSAVGFLQYFSLGSCCTNAPLYQTVLTIFTLFISTCTSKIWTLHSPPSHAMGFGLLDLMSDCQRFGHGRLYALR